MSQMKTEATTNQPPSIKSSSLLVVDDNILMRIKKEVGSLKQSQKVEEEAYASKGVSSYRAWLRRRASAHRDRHLWFSSWRPGTPAPWTLPRNSCCFDRWNTRPCFSCSS